MQIHNKKIGILSLFCLFTIISQQTFAQAHIRTKEDLIGRDKMNVIPTAVPFLLIAPDPRGGALGDAGAASDPDANSAFYNPAKFPFIEKYMGVSLSYSPWLNALVNDINLMYLSGYKKVGNVGVIGASLRYFSIGEIEFVDENNESVGMYKPNEFALDMTYARKLGDNFSMALTARYINSNLTQGQEVSGTTTHAGRTGAVDLGFFYQKEFKINRTMNSKFATGLNFSNMGGKISYSEYYDPEFLPANMRLGFAYTLEFDKYNKMTLMLDINKLMVPTPPVYAQTDSAGVIRTVYDANGNPVIAYGMDPDVPVVRSFFQSFHDAPNGFKEEMQELSYSAGVEYWYANQFAVRGGFFYEAPNKGGRKYFTLGLGLRYNVFGLDLSYLIPVASRNPLQNTLRFALMFNLDPPQKTKVLKN